MDHGEQSVKRLRTVGGSGSGSGIGDDEMSGEDDENDENDENDKNDETDENECSICLATLGEGGAKVLTRCKHWFHQDCLDGKQENVRIAGDVVGCPLCREPLQRTLVIDDFPHFVELQDFRIKTYGHLEVRKRSRRAVWTRYYFDVPSWATHQPIAIYSQSGNNRRKLGYPSLSDFYVRGPGTRLDIFLDQHNDALRELFG
ncbi:hypothetical protein HK102_009821 [Quaeritorhiza haematococci]|nr:hypothetical protein HK102_009821 [Quaeritorhiza haematococci]